MAQDARIGTQIGEYLIEGLLGRGGMGIVYLAHHERLDRKVALKILAPEWAEDESFRERFVRESRTAASLDHPNVIPVFDADEVDGLLYIAMRYVDGRDLKKIITANAPLDTERTLRLLRQIAGALDAAHERGLVHRDVKPANILVANVGSSEHAYLTDFGLTKHGSSQSGITATGAFVGTIDYIAPEQIEGKAIDGRTDIYSLGCILYECLTGEPPFKKDADVAVMYAHLMDERPSVTDARADLPTGVDRVVAKAMAKDPEERYATASEMVDDLDAALGAAPTIVRPAPVVVPPEAPLIAPSVPAPPQETVPEETRPPAEPAPRSPRSRTLLIGGLALLLVAAAAFFLTRGGNEKKEAGAAPQVHYAFFEDERGLERVELVKGSDGRYEAARTFPIPPKKGLNDIWVSTSTNGEWLLMDTERLGCKGYVCLVAAHEDGDLELVQFGPEPVHTAGSGYGDISDDGNLIVYPDDDGPHEIDLWAITRAEIAWENPTLLTGQSEFRFNDYPSLSEDGSKVLFDCRNKVYDSAGGRICEASTSGSSVRVAVGPSAGLPLDNKDSYVRHGSYAPNRSIVFEAFEGTYISGESGYHQIWRIAEPGTEPEFINPTLDVHQAPCVLDDGTIVSFHEKKLTLLSADGADVQKIDLDLGNNDYLDPRISCS